MNRRNFLKYIGLVSLGGAMIAKSALAGPIQHNSTASNLINVKYFGAAGDGVTDDTAAIQAAIDSRKGPVYVPPGNWIISQLELPTGMVLLGASAGTFPNFGTTLQQKPGTSLSLIVPKTNIPINEWWHWVQIKDMHLRGDPNATAGCGIEATRRTGENFRVENVLMTTFSESGYRMTRGSTPGSIENCAAFSCGDYGFDLQRTGIDVWNQFTLRNISGDNNGFSLVRIKQMGSGEDQISISNVKAESTVVGRQENVIIIDAAFGSLISIKNVSVKPITPMNSVVKIIKSSARLLVENYRCGAGIMPFWIDDASVGKQIARNTALTSALVNGYWEGGVGQTNVITHPAS